jgi:cytochrome c556
VQPVFQGAVVPERLAFRASRGKFCAAARIARRSCVLQAPAHHPLPYDAVAKAPARGNASAQGTGPAHSDYSLSAIAPEEGPMTSRWKQFGKALATMTGLLVVPAIGLAGDKPPMAQHLAAPEHVTAETRAQLSARMRRHGEVMSNVVRAVVLLDRPTIRVLASRIADEEDIAHTSSPANDRLAGNVPHEFQIQQTALATAARALAVAAADQSEDQLLAQRFAEVATTCVSCHSVYLHGRPDARPFGPQGK